MNQRLDFALRELRRGVSVVPDPELDTERRALIAARISGLQRELSSRDQTRQRYGRLLAAAALVLGVGVGLVWSITDPSNDVVMTRDRVRVNVMSGHASVRAGNNLHSLGLGEVELPGDAVVVADAETTTLHLASRSALELAPTSEVGLVARPLPRGGVSERVHLLKGRVRLAVPKLGRDDALSVQTADTVVEVRGTHFSVSLVERPPLAAFTLVDVDEGRVQIRHGAEVRELAAGESWRSNESEPARVVRESSSRETEPSSEPAAPPLSPAPKKPENTSQRAASSPSELAAQNRLLEAAELAKESGMQELALERLERLLGQYPEAELAHNARVQRMRLLVQMGRDKDAQAAARDYLGRHPQGFARAEALGLLGSGEGGHR